MKHFLILFFCLGFFIVLKAQKNYTEAMQQGETAFKKGDYTTAYKKYFAAEAFDPTKQEDVKKKITKVFEAIEALRKKAEDALADTKKAQTYAEKQKEIAQQALKKIIAFVNKDVGKKYQGGIIFYADSSREHGLIAAENDLVKSTEDSTYNWEEAKKVCEEYSVTVDGKKYDDWHLPSLNELALMYYFRDRVGGFRIFNYWSSKADADITRAWYINFFNGGQFNAANNSLICVRPVRAF